MFAGVARRSMGAISVPDEREGEERWVTIGLDSLARVLVVVYTWRTATFD
jgi:uncharacterized DUF497 family protein